MLYFLRRSICFECSGYHLIVFHFQGKVISEPMQLEQYIVIADYQKQNRSEVSVLAGDIVEVIEKNENGINSCFFFIFVYCTFSGWPRIELFCSVAKVNLLDESLSST